MKSEISPFVSRLSRLAIRLSSPFYWGLLAIALFAQPLPDGHVPSLEFVVQPIDGDPVSGKLAAIEKPWRISLRETGHAPFEGAELVSLRRKDYPQVIRSSGFQVLLANGDRIRAIAQRATSETLHVNSELLGELDIPLERVLAWMLNPPIDSGSREQFWRRVATGQRKQDMVILSNGDELAGSFLALDDTRVRIDGPQGATEIQRSGVRAIALSSELVSFPRPAELHAEAILADGSELTLLDGKLDGSSFRGRAAFGRDISLPLEQLVALEFRNGRLTYLSDLEAAEYHHTPYLSVAYPFERDRSVMGNVISLRGQQFRKGLGMHSRSELAYILDGRYRRLEAVVGIDDETAGQGSVVFRVLVDGKPVWESPALSGRSAPQPVRIELSDARQLTLMVDFADLGDVEDHADWADARLVR